MRLYIIGSGSSGNSYLLESSTGQILAIEAGVSFKMVKQAIDFQIDKIQAVLISHSHFDHSKFVREFDKAGILIYASKETFANLPKLNSYHWLNNRQTIFIGEFKVMPYEVVHDVHCFGFLIKHKECGNVLFITDTQFSRYIFPGLNQIIIEANYAEDILLANSAKSDKAFLTNRILDNHMSLETCKNLLRANDLTAVNNVVLIHLSDSNSDAARFKREVEDLTGKTVTIAENGMCIDFNISPF